MIGVNMLDLQSLLVVFILGFLPISEIRGAIPYAVIKAGEDANLMGFYILAGVLANLLIAPVALNILSTVEKIVMSEKFPRLLRNIYLKIVEKALEKASRMEKITLLSLALFVGIPLPVTGAWTGSLIAFLLRVDKKKAIVAISLGVLIASLIVYSAVYLGISILKTIFLL
ncbi:MAG: COG2426 family protein [Thermosphaera sp.]